MSLLKNVLVAGRSYNKEVFSKGELNVCAHWERMALERPAIPTEVDVVILISNDVDMFLTRYVREECERNFIPLAFVRKEMGMHDLEVLRKFGRGLTPSTITEVRVSEFGTKIGPRGTVNGTATVSKAELNTQDTLETILKKLTKIMQATGTDRVEIDSGGHVSIKGGTRELTLTA